MLKAVVLDDYTGRDPLTGLYEGYGYMGLPFRVVGCCRATMRSGVQGVGLRV